MGSGSLPPHRSWASALLLAAIVAVVLFVFGPAGSQAITASGPSSLNSVFSTWQTAYLYTRYIFLHSTPPLARDQRGTCANRGQSGRVSNNG